jgi:predicted Zn-dependent protease
VNDTPPHPAASSGIRIDVAHPPNDRQIRVVCGTERPSPLPEPGEDAVRSTAGVARWIAICLVVVTAFVGTSAEAQRRLQFLRDAETEHIIREMSRPILEAAAVDPEAVEFVLVNDSSLNAFVAGGQNIFLHTGLLLHSDDPLQLLGVIAHETGHIAGGHLVRLRDAIEGASAQALLGMLLGVGAALATGDAGAAAAVGMGTAEMARRNALSFNRTQESAADQAGLSYLERSGMSARGMLDFLEYLAGQELRLRSGNVEYLRTHPLTRDRIDAVRFHVERSRFSDAPPRPDVVEGHRRIRAKLYAYLNPAGALRRYREDDRSVVARYARTYAHYRRTDIPRALEAVDGLIADEPDNPFFHELRGQMLFENGRIAEAVPSLRRSVELMPRSALLQTSYAHALLEGGDPAGLDPAIRALETALSIEPRSPEAWRLTAVAWNRKGDAGRTAYATAEAALSRGDRAAAAHWAERALERLPAGSPAWLRAQDIRVAISNARATEGR